jgi:hypothetical protein
MHICKTAAGIITVKIFPVCIALWPCTCMHITKNRQQELSELSWVGAGPSPLAAAVLTAPTAWAAPQVALYPLLVVLLHAYFKNSRTNYQSQHNPVLVRVLHP